MSLIIALLIIQVTFSLLPEALAACGSQGKALSPAANNQQSFLNKLRQMPISREADTGCNNDASNNPPPVAPEQLALISPSDNTSDTLQSDFYALRNVKTRTVCVRLCDGYYFPISYPANISAYERDQQLCQNQCPGASTDLFTHRLDQDSSTMISVTTGQKYSDFETAYSYRNDDRARSCSCSDTVRQGRLIRGEPVLSSTALLQEKAILLNKRPAEEEPTKEPRLHKPQLDQTIRIVGPTALSSGRTIDLTRPWPEVPQEPDLDESDLAEPVYDPFSAEQWQ